MTLTEKPDLMSGGKMFLDLIYTKTDLNLSAKPKIKKRKNRIAPKTALVCIVQIIT